MGFFSGLKHIGRRMFDVRAWSDFDRVRDTTLFINDSIKKLITPKEAAYSETLEEAARRLNLSQDDLIKKRADFFRLAAFMGVFATLIASYFIYLAVHGYWRGAMVASSLMGVCIALTFRYHFWYFQLKKAKLGCTLKEWWLEGVWGRS